MKKFLFFSFILASTGCDTSKDKIYMSLKCAKAADFFGMSDEKVMALNTAEPYYKDIFADKEQFNARLEQKFKSETADYAQEKIQEIYDSKECKSIFGKSENTIETSLASETIIPPQSAQVSVNAGGQPPQTGILEEIFTDFDSCNLPKISYDIFKEKVNHPYFDNHNLKPYKVEQGIAIYKVNDVLYGMPISEIILPVTWSLTSVTFDLPMETVRSQLNEIFGEGFEATNKAEYGFKPELRQSIENPNHTMLYCDEPSYD